MASYVFGQIAIITILVAFHIPVPRGWRIAFGKTKRVLHGDKEGKIDGEEQGKSSREERKMQ